MLNFFIRYTEKIEVTETKSSFQGSVVDLIAIDDTFDTLPQESNIRKRRFDEVAIPADEKLEPPTKKFRNDSEELIPNVFPFNAAKVKAESSESKPLTDELSPLSSPRRSTKEENKQFLSRFAGFNSPQKPQMKAENSNESSPRSKSSKQENQQFMAKFARRDITVDFLDQTFLLVGSFPLFIIKVKSYNSLLSFR
jgi:hypothetical protein